MSECYSNSLLHKEILKFETYSSFSCDAAGQTRAQSVSLLRFLDHTQLDTRTHAHTQHTRARTHTHTR